ncbi:hypothetical protein SH661x_001351 [Planctomicrobium sp. SH661]|uniref:hypothetical protein n=1 Tax=Planctomicrobium sp. SH661 TaxID=3448124 RepID=UPI003F5C3B27
MNIILGALYLIGLYTTLSVNVGGVEVLGVLSILAAVLLVLLNYHRGGSLAILFSLQLLACAVVSTALCYVQVPPTMEAITENIKSLCQLSSSLICFLSPTVWLSSYHTRTVNRLFFWICLGLLLVATLETVVPVVRTVSDNFRKRCYSDDRRYDSSERDERQYGLVRPTFFTQEPSHLAKFYAFVLLSYLLTSASRYRYAAYGLLVMAGLVVLRSPSLVAAVPLGLIVVLSRMRVQNAMPILTSGGLLVVVFGYVAATQVFSERILEVSEGKDLSSFQRIVGPYKLIYETLAQYPMFGAGVGGREVIVDIILDVYEQFSGRTDMVRFVLSDLSFVITNAFAELWIYLGIVGGSFFLWQLYRVEHAIASVPFLVFLGIFMIIFNSDGAFVSFRVWSYFGLVTAAIYHNGLLYSVPNK